MNLKLLKSMVMASVVLIAMGIYLKTGRPPKSAHPDASPLKAHRAEAANGIRDRHEEEMLIMALKKMPGHTPVLLKLAELESAAGDLQGAAGRLRAILNKDPGNRDANLELGKVLFELGDFRGAIRHTESILRTDPTHEDALYNMGAIYANLGNKKDAAAYWKRLFGLHSNSERTQRAQLMITRLETGTP